MKYKRSSADNHKRRKTWKHKHNMAAVNSTVILSLVEELTDDSMLLEASSCDGDNEFLLFLLITSKERENDIRMTVTLTNCTALYNTIQCNILYLTKVM